MSAAQRFRFDANLKWLFTEVPFERRFEAAAAAGFTGVEYASPYGHRVARLRHLLDDAGLAQVLINTPTGPPGTATRSGIACFPDRVADFRDGVDRALEYAVELGSAFVHVVGGIVPDGVTPDRAFARYVTNIGWAAERAKSTNVRLLLEVQNKRDVPGFVLTSQAHAVAVVEAVGAENVGVLLDFYHAQIDEGDLITTLRSVYPAVFHFQLADPPSRNEPGTGEIGWSSVFAAIRDLGYAGWIGCEYAPRTNTIAGLNWIEELAR